MPRHLREELDDFEPEDINDNPGYDLSALHKPSAEVPSELRKTPDFHFRCSEYIWNVHRGPIIKESRVFEMMTSMHFKEGQEHTIDLPEDEPDLIARMIQFCYFKKYSLSPITPIEGILHAKTVEAVLREGFIGSKDDFETPYEPACDAVLHMKMYDLADKYDMQEMGRYAMRKIWSCLQGKTGELDAFWPCVEFLDEMAEMASEQVIKSCLVFATLRTASSRNQVDFEGERFKELERLRPEMAKDMRAQALRWYG